VSSKVKIGLIQAKNDVSGEASVAEHKEAAIAKHLKLIEEASNQGAQIVCLQEIFYGPYFCAEQTTKWYEAAEPVPDGPTTRLMQDVAKKHKIVLVVPVYEKEKEGVYYNTAAVIDADGTYLGKYRKHHIPQVQAGEDPSTGFWEKYYFKPGNLGYSVFDTAYAKIGVYICYDRHFPEGARLLGLAGAEIIFNPSATTAGLSEYLWKLEQPAHAVANGIYVAAINRVGWEKPWNMGEFYGQSYLVDPRGQFVKVASRDKDEVLVAEMDRELIRKVRDTWQFYRDRRPESYGNLVESL
jgi:beta-ureidopropionase